MSNLRRDPFLQEAVSTPPEGRSPRPHVLFHSIRSGEVRYMVEMLTRRIEFLADLTSNLLE